MVVKSEAIRFRVSKRKLAEMDEAVSALHRKGVKVTRSDIIRAGIEKELGWIGQTTQYDPTEYRSRETELWDLITGFLLDESKS